MTDAHNREWRVLLVPHRRVRQQVPKRVSRCRTCTWRAPAIARPPPPPPHRPPTTHTASFYRCRGRDGRHGRDHDAAAVRVESSGAGRRRLADDDGSARRSPDAAPAPVALAMRGVRKLFGEFTAVDGIDLEVRRGEFITLLGPSGSGKTTTLRMIAGFLTQDEGSSRSPGQEMRRVPPTVAMWAWCSRTTPCSRT